MTDVAECEALGRALGDLYARSQRIMDRLMADQGISFSRHKLLSYIKKDGPIRSTDISAHFGFAPRTVTEAIDILERDGMVRRDPDPLDRRAKRISITPLGQGVIDSTEPLRRAFMVKLFGTLDPEDRASLLAALAKLIHAVQD